LNSTITFFDLVGEDLEQVERKMREEPKLAGYCSPAPPPNVGPDSASAILNNVTQDLLTSGGKRVRPALAMLVSHVYPADRERIVALAAAVELLHTATLVHDDLIDGALLRRGNPTLNAAWTPGATVLTGDYLFARAADLAAQTNSVRVMRLFAQTLMVICSGEIKQMFDKRANLNRQQYYDRIYAKTAALFAVSTEAAGILGGAPEAAVAALRDYGKNLGMAFQIVDDVLDFVSDEDQLGKPVGSDMRVGLVTLPTLWFLEQNDDHGIVGDIINNGRRDDASIREAVRIILESGAADAAMDEARHFVCSSQAALELLPSGGSRNALWELSDFVVERNW
jgi:geranylgeranyl pyrophosphate synthase